MDGWVFAVVALGAILGFEYVLFRYVETKGPVNGRVDGSRRYRDPNGGGTSTAGPSDSNEAQAGDGRRRATAEAVIACRHCGVRNADAPTVVFCRSCLERLA